MDPGESQWVRFAWKIGLVIAAALALAACGSSGGTISSQNLLQQPSAAPTIVSVTPTSGPLAGGTSVTITGTNFTGSGGGTLVTAPTVTFGGVTASNITLVSSSEITATTPPDQTSGAVDVVVTNPGGQSATLANGFTYSANNPTILNVSPSSGTTAGGTAVTIAGTNFDAGTTVTFGGNAATNVLLSSSTQLSATTPAHAAGTDDVVVTTSTGLSATLTGGFTYTAPAPTITSVSPTSGPTGGGTVVTITGTNFQSGVTVAFGQVAAAAVKFGSSAQLQATTPSEPAGLVDVTVTNPDGQSAILRGAFTFVFHSVSLAWTASTSTVAGYNIYRSKVSGGPYTKINPALTTGTTYTDQTISGNTTYYYVATAVDSSGNQSVFSNQVSAPVPGP